MKHQNNIRSHLPLYFATTLLLSSFFFPFFVQLTSAQASTDPLPATSSATTPDNIKENIKERIRQVVESQSPNSITHSSTKGWFGIIDSISAETITISHDGTTRLVGTTPGTHITKNSTALSLEDLEISTAVVAIGSVDDTDILSASTILSLSEIPTRSTKRSTIATITQIDTRLDIIELTTNSAPLLIQVDSDSSFSDASLTSPDQLIEFADLNPHDQLLVIYQPNSKDPSELFGLTLHRLYTAPEPTPDDQL